MSSTGAIERVSATTCIFNLRARFVVLVLTRQVHPEQSITCVASNYSEVTLRSMANPEAEGGLDELQFRAWRAFLYAYSVVVRKLDRELIRAHRNRLGVTKLAREASPGFNSLHSSMDTSSIASAAVGNFLRIASDFRSLGTRARTSSCIAGL
jgi:hypothetical protein